jgi:hypothetical protein
MLIACVLRAEKVERAVKSRGAAVKVVMNAEGCTVGVGAAAHLLPIRACNNAQLLAVAALHNTLQSMTA